MTGLLRSIAVIGICSALATPGSNANAQGNATKAPAESSDARALLRLEDAWTTGLVKRDGALFRRLLAPGFVYTEDDRLMTRDQVLHEIEAGTDTTTAAHNEGMVVHSFGETSVVTGWLVVRGRGATGAFDRRYRFTDTWAKRNGSWQIVAAQDYLVPAKR